MNGRALIDDISQCRLPYGQLSLWWLGQHGFVLKFAQTIVYLDAFLSDLPSRTVPPLLRGSEVTNARLVLGSHDHGDHIDRDAWPAMAAASPDATFIVPALVRNAIVADLALPPDRVMGADEAKPLELAGVRIWALPAAHEFLDTDPATGRHPYLGFVIEGNGCTVYHAGDCCLYEGLHQRLRSWRLDAMILPINGRDARRLRANCIGNMTYQEAADLAGALAPGCVIPAHYEMFEFNCAKVSEFVEYVQVKYPQQKVLVPSHGERSKVGTGHRTDAGGRTC